jgi:hypothetical protein
MIDRVGRRGFLRRALGVVAALVVGRRTASGTSPALLCGAINEGPWPAGDALSCVAYLVTRELPYRWRSDRFDVAAMQSLYGCVNSAEFDGHPAGTLAVRSWRASARIGADGGREWEIEARFILRLGGGWNYALYPRPGGFAWRELEPGPFPGADFGRLKIPPGSALDPGSWKTSFTLVAIVPPTS